MKILLDTNFIVTCIKEHIDFENIMHEITTESIKWIVPQQIINELGNIKDSKHTTKKEKDTATIAFEILQQLKPRIIDLGENPNIDIGIINYVLNKDIAVATLDKDLKHRLRDNRIVTMKGKKHLQIL